MAQELIHSLMVVKPNYYSIDFDAYLISTDMVCPLSPPALQKEFFENDVNICKNYEFIQKNCLEYLKKAIESDFVANKFTNKYQRLRIKMDALMFSFLMYEINRSKSFRTNVLKHILTFLTKKHKDIPNFKSNVCPFCEANISFLLLCVNLNVPEKNIMDIKWNIRIQILVNERSELENTMAWLSTLGGAFSALGDEYVDCAKKAGLISVQQLQLALRLGDPITICRCKIYLAMSLLQREQYTRTKRLLRELYNFSISHEGSKDFRLRNMCIAVWNRLKYVLSLRSKTLKLPGQSV